MTNENEATSVEGPNPPDRMAKARAAKAAKAKVVTTQDSRDELIAQMAQQIANLQSAVLEQGKQRFERQEATLAPIPAASAEVKPGSYRQIGLDANGAPIMGKVRWTRPIIEATYESVTFVPRRNMVVGPHGISFNLIGNEPNTVPGIVKDIYDAVIEQETQQFARTKPLTAAERSDIDSRASEAPGKHWSRVYRAGYGLTVRQEQAEAAPTEAAPAPVETPAK